MIVQTPIVCKIKVLVGEKMFSELDEKFMHVAIELAQRGRGRVSPNPPVGCVIVKDEKIIGRGFHENYGGAHAEVMALNDARAQGVDAATLSGATAFVTLMPCHHHGKTPPCTEALLAAKIARVVAAVEDPNPVSGEGKNYLAQFGVRVEVGLLAALAAKTMAGFLKFHRQKLPHVLLKYAMTLDGKIAQRDGAAKWITNAAAREYVHQLRAANDAIMIGIGTALMDQPRLNVRVGETVRTDFRQPYRVIIDSHLCLTPNMPLFTSVGGEWIILHGTAAAAPEKFSATPNVHLIACPTNELARLQLPAALKLLAEKFPIREVLCEGGAQLNASLLQARLVDEAAIFIAPKFLGGSGIAATESDQFFPLNHAPQLTNLTTQRFADDLLIRGDINYAT